MANTFTKIASTEVGSTSVSSVSFTSIPQDYTDLVIYFSARHDGANFGADSEITFNSNTSNRSQKYIIVYTVNNTVNTGTQTYFQTGIAPGSSSTTGVFSNSYIYIPSYTTAYSKTFTTHDSTGNFFGSGGNSNYQWYSTNMWADNSAITSIQIFPSNAAFKWVQYSSFYLYGIKNS